MVGNDVLHIQNADSDKATVDQNFLDCDIVFGNAPAEWLEQSNNLRWMQLESVGFGEYRNLNWQSLGGQIILTNLAGFFTDPVAQSMLAGILAHYRGIASLAQLRQEYQWIGAPIRKELRSLSNAKVVLLGNGSINQRLAELLEPFRCAITNFDSQSSLGSLDESLTQADIVACVVPETNATVGLFNQSRLRLLKKDSLFVNFGRGSIVDEDALASALNNNEIGGAIIDVTIDEPLPPKHPFWATPNTILTQHSGGGTNDEIDRKIDVFVENLSLFRNNQTLNNSVDFKRGY